MDSLLRFFPRFARQCWMQDVQGILTFNNEAWRTAVRFSYRDLRQWESSHSWMKQQGTSASGSNGHFLLFWRDFLAEELQPWAKTFPFEFYSQMCRLKNWPGIYAVKRPSLIGRYTNDIVYERLGPGLLEELKIRNPVMSTGYRRHKHHQWFTPELGHPKLKEHLAGVIAIMRISRSWNGFRARNTLNKPH